MKTSEGTGNDAFYWQGGYAAFSVSESNVESVVKYIENQAEHQKSMTFQEERCETQRPGGRVRKSKKPQDSQGKCGFVRCLAAQFISGGQGARTLNGLLRA